MAAAIASHSGGMRSASSPYRKVVILSFVFHAFVITGVPLVISLAQSTMRFERPQTFQLVAAPPSLRPFTPAAQKKLSKELVRQKIKKESVAPVPSESSKREENVDELASMLEELPQPARVAAVGDFKYNWYTAQVEEKIRRFWNPPSESKKDSVVVSFTIDVNGSISDPVVTKSSGNGNLDNLAIRAITMAAPFSKLPPGVSGNKYEMNCTLRPTRN